jgi:hypothetical protein
MDIEELTELENEWLAKHPYGTVSDLNAACRQMGIYEASWHIFAKYVALARQGDLGAIKRAPFLAWYELAEPGELSGIGGLDPDLKKDIFAIVNNLAANDQLDDELEWTLPWYCLITEYYVPYVPRGFPALEEASRTDPHQHKKRCLESSFDNRGQMGEYWKSIQSNCP